MSTPGHGAMLVATSLARVAAGGAGWCGQIKAESGDDAGQILLVEPIGKAQQRQVIAATQHYIEESERLFKRSFARVPVLFDLRGRAAGMFKVVGRQRCIRYNPWIFAKYFDENLRDTVPHEVAHFVVHEIHGLRSVKPHGPQWLHVMQLFDADPGVTFDLDLAGIPKRQQRTHPYRCACRLHEVSTTRHNRVLKGVGLYHCRVCGVELVYDAQVSTASSTPL